MKLMASRYDGRCAASSSCKKGIKVLQGANIYWHKDHNGSRVWHEECARAMAAGTIPNNLPVGHNVPQGPTVAPTPQPVPITTKKSCETCPNLVSPKDTAAVFNAPINSYMCKARGLVVAPPSATISSLAQASEDAASSCNQHGTKVTVLPDRYESRVGVNPSHVNAPAASRFAPSGCTQCKFYAKPETVAAHFGWGVGMCTARGKLIMPASLISEALDCGMGDAGQYEGEITEVQLLPRFEGWTQGVDPSAPTSGGVGIPKANPLPNRAQLRSQHQVDPRQYETDKPVTPGEAAAHIRAWRKVVDPEGYGEPIFMPIFDGPALMASECVADDHTNCDHDPRSTVESYQPELYVDHNDMLYQLAAVMFRHDYVPLAEGPSGSGKTVCFAWMAWLMDIPFIRIAIDAGTEVYHLSGEKELIVDEVSGQAITTYKLGRFSAWYSRTAMICVDESNLKADVWQFLRPTADGGKRIDLDDAQGIGIERGPRTFLALTQNPAWDPLYIGTEPVSAADLQRVAPIWFDYPDEAVEREMIVKHCHAVDYDIDQRVLDQIMQISNDIRRMKQSVPIPWGVRSNVKVAKFSESFRLPLAYKRAVLDGQESSVVELVMQSVTSVVG